MRETGERRVDMQVGDLVRVKATMFKEDFPLGVIIGFDEDEDPIVFERGQKLAHYPQHLEVINESKNR